MSLKRRHHRSYHLRNRNSRVVVHIRREFSHDKRIITSRAVSKLLEPLAFLVALPPLEHRHHLCQLALANWACFSEFQQTSTHANVSLHILRLKKFLTCQKLCPLVNQHPQNCQGNSDLLGWTCRSLLQFPRCPPPFPRIWQPCSSQRPNRSKNDIVNDMSIHS